MPRLHARPASQLHLTYGVPASWLVRMRKAPPPRGVVVSSSARRSTSPRPPAWSNHSRAGRAAPVAAGCAAGHMVDAAGAGGVAGCAPHDASGAASGAAAAHAGALLALPAASPRLLAPDGWLDLGASVLTARAPRPQPSRRRACSLEASWQERRMRPYYETNLSLIFIK